MPRSHCPLLMGLLALAWSTATALAADIGQEVPGFVRGGILLPADANSSSIAQAKISHAGQDIDFEACRLSSDHQLLAFDWQPHTEYRLQTTMGSLMLRSPHRPAPLLLHQIELEDVTQAALGGTSPDAVVRFSPDGLQVALGTFGGWLHIVDCLSGQTLHQSRIAEGMVKQLAWSPDGQQLYVGEQSPDANLFALLRNTNSGGTAYSRAWSVRLADLIESSRPPANDRFGIYSLPGVFDLKVAPEGGALFVAGVHSWSVEGVLRNRSTLSCYRPDGTLEWRLPDQGAWPLVLGHFAIDRRGERLLMLASQSQQPVGNEPLRTDTLYLLDGTSGKIESECRLQPLAPHFSRVYTWDSLALNDTGTRAAVGLSDGRGLLFEVNQKRLQIIEQVDLATPVVIGNTPVVASASYTRIFGDRVYFQTQNSHIPFGNSQAALQAPALHRGSNRLTVVDFQGQVQWRYRGPFSLSGSWCSPSSGLLMLACRELPAAAEPGQYGFLAFDIRQAGGGSEKLQYYYPTTGPVLFNSDVSADGRRIAVIEVPVPTPDGRETIGRHRLHLVH